MYTHNGSRYTLKLVNTPEWEEGYLKLIESNGLAAINYLADHIRWKGVLDFVIIWGLFNTSKKGPGFGGYGGKNLGPHDSLPGLIEATTGTDINGSDYDAGTWVRNRGDYLINYGEEVYVDPRPNPTQDDASETDFLSIFLHETLHSLGMWSRMQHITTHPNSGPTKFDTLTEEIDGQWFFTGQKTREILGKNLPLALTGSRDHYSHELEFDFDLMREYGLRQKWQISNLDLAILHDLGHEVIQWIDEEDVEEDKQSITKIKHGHYISLNGTSDGEKIKAKGRHEFDIFGFGGNDILIGGPLYDVLDGGMGNDKLKGKRGADKYILSPGKDKFLGFKLKQGDFIQIDDSITFELESRGKNSAIVHDDGISIVKKISIDDLESIIEIV